jgi:hypothetical protein
MADDDNTRKDEASKDGASRLDQTIGFIGAIGFLALLVYTQTQH